MMMAWRWWRNEARRAAIYSGKIYKEFKGSIVNLIVLAFQAQFTILSLFFLHSFHAAAGQASFLLALFMNEIMKLHPSIVYEIIQ